MIIRPLEQPDLVPLLRIFTAIVEEGATYVQEEVPTATSFKAYWQERGGLQLVAEENAEILGGCTIRPNQEGRGSHVATASYIVSAAARGRGVGRKLAERSLREARAMGFRAMQFNMVVSTNPAVRLWQSLGFQIVGTLPRVFRHQALGDVDAFVMHLDLTD
jgi:L-amino acid N-acyltransferase YncA